MPVNAITNEHLTVSGLAEDVEPAEPVKERKGGVPVTHVVLLDALGRPNVWEVPEEGGPIIVLTRMQVRTDAFGHFAWDGLMGKPEVYRAVDLDHLGDGLKHGRSDAE